MYTRVILTLARRWQRYPGFDKSIQTDHVTSSDSVFRITGTFLKIVFSLLPPAAHRQRGVTH